MPVFFVARAQEAKLARTGSVISLFTTGWGRLSLPLTVVGIGVVLILFAQNRVNVLRRGGAVAATLDSVVPISAPCVHVHWIDVSESARGSLPSFGPDARLVLLGGSGSTTVLYDASTNATLRVPANRVALSSCRGQ